MKYDDASWHYGGNYFADLPPSAGATHIGMFVAWALLNGLAGELYTEECPESLENLASRRATPGEWFISNCDEKFTDEDLNDVGNSFAEAYYANSDGMISSAGSYLSDYDNTFPEVESTYHVPDTWDSFDRLSPIITKRFTTWQKASALVTTKPWWQFWE